MNVHLKMSEGPTKRRKKIKLVLGICGDKEASEESGSSFGNEDGNSENTSKGGNHINSLDNTDKKNLRIKE
jgi:hypothetical protein